jgi:transcriptional regulator with XRE-family HTH domain
MNEESSRDMSFGEWLRQRRRILDLTQQELADQVGCARITLRRIESGSLKPSRELAIILLDKLGAPPAQQEQWLRIARGLGEFPEISAWASAPVKPSSNLPTLLSRFIGRNKELL